MPTARSLKNCYHLLRAVFANLFFRFPARKMTVIGVTGTDGKTTTAHLIHRLLVRAGRKASLISSVYAVIAGKEYKTGFHVTTPNSWFLQKAIAEAVSRGDEYLVLEVTAHGVDQQRVWGIPFQVAVVTNITPEHLRSRDGQDYFLTYENYLRTKARLLQQAEVAIINADDQSFALLSALLKKPKGRLLTYSLKKKADFKVNFPAKEDQTLAEFNKANYSAAFAVCRSLGLPAATITAGFSGFTLPLGRLETVYQGDFEVIIDFAHTINGVFAVMRFLKSRLKSGGRLIHVFGAAGLRDQTKREKMGQASGQFADIVILTEEDYRTEDPAEIAAEIAVGLDKAGFHLESPAVVGRRQKTYAVIIDRNKAIEKAVQIGRKNDIIVLTGKGHEESLCRGQKEFPWSEHQAVKKALDILKKR